MGKKELLLSEPYGGGMPSVGQAAVIGSTTFSENTPLSPSTMAQSMSVKEDGKGFQGILNTIVGNFFSNKVNDEKLLELGICLQGRGNCGIHDAFVSHESIDSNALANSIGLHHSVNGGDLSKPLKAIVNVHYREDASVFGFLPYFATTFNGEAAPGGYLWPTYSHGETAPNPRMSAQIFDTYLDQEGYESMLEIVPGSIIKVARMNLTTVENIPYGVKAGQIVDLLVLDASEVAGIPGFIFPWNLDKWKDPLGEAARNISLSTNLRTVLSDFVAL